MPFRGLTPINESVTATEYQNDLADRILQAALRQNQEYLVRYRRTLGAIAANFAADYLILVIDINQRKGFSEIVFEPVLFDQHVKQKKWTPIKVNQEGLIVRRMRARSREIERGYLLGGIEEGDLATRGLARVNFNSLTPALV